MEFRTPDGTINPEGMNSLNHYTYGSIEAGCLQMYAGSGPYVGFREAVIATPPGPAAGISERKDRHIGRHLREHWEYRDGKVYYEIKVPFGASAQIILPEEEPVNVTAGTYTYERNAE